MRSVTINPVLNGWIVVVGCTTVLFTKRHELLLELNNYIKDPKGTEERFRQNAVNKDIYGTPEVTRNLDPRDVPAQADWTGNALRTNF